ncbi:cellulase family glycosylhydrolase [Kiritimatiellaeota bacterium B1221]|nr:cellulase family glycosylhydrolase [Kiritimatiellaeota bacterium B1221]
MKILIRNVLLGAVVGFWLGVQAAEGDAASEVVTFIDSDFEPAGNEKWPKGWPKIAESSWETEAGNSFIRIQSVEPGKTLMLYREIVVPEGVEEVQLNLRARVTNLKRGKNSWFDARIMMEWMDKGRKKVPGKAPVLTWPRSTDEWEKESVTFSVPKGAYYLKFMPCLFQVESGTFDMDDVQIRVAPTAEEIAANKPDYEKLPPLFVENFDGAEWSMKPGSEVITEEGESCFRLYDPQSDRVIKTASTRIELAEEVEAVELTWRQRVTRMIPGPRPYFDARMGYAMLDSKGKAIKPSADLPSLFVTEATDGWVEMQSRFLVNRKAKALELRPTLYTANAAMYDVDQITVRMVDPDPVREAWEAKELRMKEARLVPDEAAVPESWPSMLKVVGNRLHDEEGNEVWLQGLNAGGLETIASDEQAIKSVVEAIENWNSNCIRLPINETYWYGKGKYQEDGGAFYRAQVDKAVKLAANRGAYLVIDLHRFRAPKKEHAEFWIDCAERYKDHPAVLFDIFNEPHGISWEVWRNGGFVAEAGKHDESAFLTDEEKKANSGFESVGMQGLVEAVRSTGAKNIIIAGGVWWCNDLRGVVNGYALDDLGGNGIMYSWHTYHWHDGWEKKVLPVAEKYPIFLGEVGADIIIFPFVPEEEVQENAYTWVPDMLGFIQKYKINWTGWCFHPRASPILISDWEYTPTPFWGEFAKKALAGEPFELQKMR